MSYLRLCLNITSAPSPPTFGLLGHRLCRRSNHFPCEQPVCDLSALSRNVCRFARLFHGPIFLNFSRCTRTTPNMRPLLTGRFISENATPRNSEGSQLVWGRIGSPDIGLGHPPLHPNGNLEPFGMFGLQDGAEPRRIFNQRDSCDTDHPSSKPLITPDLVFSPALWICRLLKRCGGFRLSVNPSLMQMRDCIAAVNSERWVHCGGSLQEYVPITAPTVSAIPSL
jgi:hypothetical protein